MCAYMRKTWIGKLHIDRIPIVEKADKDFAGIKTVQLMLIPTPEIVDAYIRQIPRGRQVDSETIRKDQPQGS